MWGVPAECVGFKRLRNLYSTKLVSLDKGCVLGQLRSRPGLQIDDTMIKFNSVVSLGILHCLPNKSHIEYSEDFWDWEKMQ